MNNDNNLNINWLNVIVIKEFQKYLNLNSIKELSLLSKLFRLKLSPKLFDTIKLDRELKSINSDYESYFKVKEITVLNNLVKSGVKEVHYRQYVDKLLNDIKHRLQGIKSFVSSIEFRYLEHLGYFLFPIFTNFENLEILDLYECTIPYSILINLGKLFPKLKKIELGSVLLVKLPTDSAHSENFLFPPNLSCLNISKVKATEQDDLFNPYERLYIEYFPRNSYRFSLPRIALPNLLELDYDGDDEDDSDLEEFSNINPNLKSLKVQFFHLDREYNLNSLEYLDVGYVECYDDEVKFATNHNLNELKLLVEGDFYFENVTKLCLLCPNLVKLNLCLVCIDDFQQAFDEFLIPILSNMPKLKTLELELIAEEDEILDITNFPYIETFILFSDEPNILNVKFARSENLRNIEFKCNYFDCDYYRDEFRKLCRKTKNWKFTYSEDLIKGYKLSQ
ncbi:hypothetical protein CONCODRAFT_18564 [Conidiobolus coronatus NRRL 28638]|uniref:F-box domain-containing protein n=1 Tax=Conidiobolus coronatus (strain ATCC 28846 / CBS 209.66 / NRRL 28638) TaxID=796925 RepID=A0A137P2J3_CONC2|nr:hypothetical protein CONCODRAFT_18564 [Conidiobolus coronatus NRRL 28638]|eukprot:KXN69129.1 hypothetical protein CONCODRAFT_18564 [Conidiobolus coronatus NRRL 28638]